jgi:flagellar hook-associated protein 1 FlgK
MSTFSGLNTALSALRYNRVAMDVASGNIANVGTEGYTRRTVQGASVGTPDHPAMWSRYVGAGDGVMVSSIDRMADPLLDIRARREHGNQSYLDIRQAVLERVESGIGEPGDTGVAAAIADFRSAWHDLANNPGSDAARSAVLGRAATLADAIRIQARNIDTEAGDQRLRIQSDVAEVNTIASDQVAASIGLSDNPSLRALSEACVEPWQSILADHHEAFVTVTAEIAALADANRDLITAGYRSARETLMSLDGGATAGYGADGAAVAAPDHRQRLVDWSL